MYVYLMIAAFVVAIASSLLKNINTISWINMVSMFSLALLALFLGIEISQNNFIYYFGNAIYIDSLSEIQLIIITTISFITAVYSHSYISDEYKEKIISLRKAKIYFLLFQTFVFSMIFLSLSNNIMGMWIGLEGTTLATAFLIGFNNSRLSLEAAWKYIIICSVGLALGLIGIILFIYSLDGELKVTMLQWTYLISRDNVFNKDVLVIAFAFIFVGLGTKAGIAPMHTWLSDGHSEAPSPISAMMSGILINLALYVIVRFYIIISQVNGIDNLRYFFICFGCISLIISTFSILKQTNYKRLLAFSSVENIGIISIGFGFGGTLGIFGALLHSLIHGYGKSLLFMVSGNILKVYKTKRIANIKALIKNMPCNSAFLILGMLVITGTPPFGSFFSEFKILQSGINGGHYIASGVLVLSLLIAFAGFLIPFIKMVFQGEEDENISKDKDRENLIPLFIATAFIIFISCSFNNILYPLLNKATAIICG